MCVFLPCVLFLRLSFHWSGREKDQTCAGYNMTSFFLLIYSSSGGKGFRNPALNEGNLVSGYFLHVDQKKKKIPKRDIPSPGIPGFDSPKVTRYRLHGFLLCPFARCRHPFGPLSCPQSCHFTQCPPAHRLYSECHALFVALFFDIYAHSDSEGQGDEMTWDNVLRFF